MKISTRFGLCIIIILLLICLYIFSAHGRTRNGRNGGNGGNGGGRKEGLDVRTPAPGLYKMSRTEIDASDNYVNERVLTIDNAGHVTESNLDTDILHKSTMKCIAPAAYNPTIRGCDCSAGYTYSTKLGCLSKCPLHQQFDLTTSSCINICTNPNEYYNTTEGTCQVCPYGYQQDENNKCMALPSCPLGQGYADHTGVCDVCPIVGQSYNDSNECTNICLDYQEFNPLSESCDNRCKKNEYYDFDTKSCTKCPIGMVNDGANKCIFQPECPAGLMFGDNSVCISKCLEKWEMYDPTHDVCTQQCIGKNGAGQYNQYLDLVYTDECITCPDGQISNGMNGCMPGPPAPVPTCEPGYSMNVKGKCEMTCAPWRFYDEMTDSCRLRCDTSQRWDTDTNLGCVNCPEGFTIDAQNQCTVPIPKAPLVHTPQPTCPPGYLMDHETKTCYSVCQDYATNNIDDPLLCDLKCQARNEYWSRATKLCATCGNGYLNDRDNKCNDCDALVGYVPKDYKVGTLNYHSVDDANELSRGFYCMPLCERGYVRVDEDPNLPNFNTCNKCDVKPNKDLRVLKYEMENSSHKCLPVCQFPNRRDDPNNSDSYDPAHPCPKCELGYTQDVNAPNNPNHLKVVSSTDQVACMPDSCPIGYVIGINPNDKYDISCNACDIAGGYTNDIREVESTNKVDGVTYPPNDLTMSNYKCFPKKCPNHTALGSDLTCSLCAKGFYGNPKVGCGSPEETVSIASITKVVVGKTTLTNTTVTVDGFTMDLSLKFKIRNYLFAKAKIDNSAFQNLKDNDTKAPWTWAETTLSFPGLKIPDAGLKLTINYYDAKDKNIVAATNTYTISYKESTLAGTTSTPYDVGDFAAGYILIGGGQAGGKSHDEEVGGQCINSIKVAGVDNCEVGWVHALNWMSGVHKCYKAGTVPGLNC